jgi:hypothetical protein
MPVPAVKEVMAVDGVNLEELEPVVQTVTLHPDLEAEPEVNLVWLLLILLTIRFLAMGNY